MTLGIMQPYFMPYISYFQLIKAVDKYIIFDDVNYINQGWINRNNLLINGERKMFSITLKKASSSRLIKDIEIGDDFRKIIKTLETNYKKAPYFNETMNLLIKSINYPDKRLGVFLTNCIKEVLSYLQVNTEILISSEIKKDNSFKGQDRVINMCQQLNADTYINAIGGINLYDKNLFKEKGIDLFFLKSHNIVYQQYKNEFIPSLSLIDTLMFNAAHDVNGMLDKYTLA